MANVFKRQTLLDDDNDELKPFNMRADTMDTMNTMTTEEYEEEKEETKNEEPEEAKIKDMKLQLALQPDSLKEDTTIEKKIQSAEKLRDEAAKKRKKDKDHLPLFVDGKIKIISDVDVVGEQFTLRFHVHFGMPITEEMKEQIDACEGDEAKKAFTPTVIIINLQSEDNPTFEDKKISKVGKRYDVSHIPGYKKEKYPYIFRYKLDYNVTCFEEMELENFPFDCQDLSIDMRCEDQTYFFAYMKWAPKDPPKKDANKEEAKPALAGTDKETDKSIAKKLPGAGGGSWFSMDTNNLCLKDLEVADDEGGPGLMCELFLENSKANKGGRAYSHFVIRIKLKRNIGFYFWNFFLTNGLLSASALTVFSFEFEGDGMSDRFAILFTLLLTIMASKFVISDQVPKLPYNTLLDWYIVANFLYIMLMTFLQTPFSLIKDDDIAEKYDTGLLISMVALLVIGHIAFIVDGRHARHVEERKLGADSQELIKLGVKNMQPVKIKEEHIVNDNGAQIFRSMKQLPPDEFKLSLSKLK
eukprot:CAMPEP_0202695436 /NCGR_PEP_ID=MMETSP1385-20130828/9029_1 /ASSEMBLY_ACC=CAM_ASM_000861 /TAXON_ID=933848 /ORGANISM="Elphidium margaritaceum" /LENGTH=526 /DNA_ID=CAMNT_0049351459 /DNA_START=30 /DNA_END=1610 /DNA_ORIENTATION=+